MHEKRGPVSAILFYDGECGLCSRAVRFLMKRDSQGMLRFAPLQGETAAGLLDPEHIEKLATAVYSDRQGRTHLRSEAILHALLDIGRIWRPLAQLALRLPQSWRDGLYDWIARRRHRLFPKSSCSLPSAEDEGRFLP